MSIPWPWLRTDRQYDTEPLSYRAYRKAVKTAKSRSRNADLFDRIEETDWDLLVILDACRYDILSEITESVVVDKAISPAHHTGEFVDIARERGVFDGTAYVSANAKTSERPPGDVELDGLYEDLWDSWLRTRPPTPVYERAVEHLSAGEQVVAHTVQPHYPHICEIAGRVVPVPNGVHPAHIGYNFRDDEIDFETTLLREISGPRDLERVRQSYIACTRFAFDRVHELAGRLADDGNRVVVTADHGELLGEWGIVGHPGDVGLRPQVEVPWIVYEPFEDQSREKTDASVQEQLAHLGYVDG